MNVIPNHLTFLFPRLKIELKGRHFDTIMIKAESQAALTATPNMTA
jgi:hypothetical protein